MSLGNQISISFTDPELQIIDDSLTAIEKVLTGKTVQLKPEESRRYGKLGNETENWVEMVNTDCITVPALVPAFVDTNEWAIDEAARAAISPRLSRMEAISKNLGDTNRLIGFDIYNTCLAVYNNVRYLMTQNVPGSSAYYEKWKVQFPGRPHSVQPVIPPKQNS
jgi:hypothetical protein